MKANFWDRNQLKLAPVFFLTPAMLFFAVYVLHPIFSSLLISFFEWDGVGEMMWVGIGNYVEMWDDDRVHTAIINNILWLGIFLLAPPLSLALGLFLNQNILEIKFAKSLFFFPFVVSPVVVGLIFSWFYNPKYGLLDSFLELFGLQPLALLSDENFANYGIIAAAMWPQIAYCLILYITGLAALNKEIIESAKIDGASGWGMVWNIILPQLRPATFIAVVVSVLGAYVVSTLLPL